jgi:hypothetical protein
MKLNTEHFKEHSNFIHDIIPATRLRTSRRYRGYNGSTDCHHMVLRYYADRL